MPLVQLSKKPKGVTVIEGFPGYGLVGTIATGFLIEHLKCEQIGKYFFEEVPATLAIHECKAVDPIGIYYDKENNIVIIHALTAGAGIEFKAADVVLDICKQLEAKELIAIEGIGSQSLTEEPRAFHYCTSKEKEKKMLAAGIEHVGEGIIVGVTSAILMKAPKELPISAVFAETHTNLPDSKAAAKIIEVLDKYLGLEVDYRPLLRQAEEFEKKLKAILEQATKAHELKEKKALSYVG
ncbi:MAG: PAC2 family protein [Candidatus Woesearchaeota archaeon]